MGAFADLDDVVNSLTGGSSGAPEAIWYYKDGYTPDGAPTAPVVGRWNSLWYHSGVPSHGAIPTGSAVYPTNATAGALKQTDPAGGTEKWLCGGTINTFYHGTLMLYDRLAHYGGLSGTTTGAQTCTMTLSGRYSGSASVGNQIWAEINTTIGSTARTISAAYTDQDGNSSVTSESTGIGGTGYREDTRFIQIPLASGDTGVRAVASVTLSDTTGTAGDFAVVIVRPLMFLGFSYQGATNIRDLIGSIPMPIEIETDACLAWAWFAGNTSIPSLVGNLVFCEA